MSRKTKLANRVVLTERDNRLLRFLWKWKLLTTRAIHLKFFPQCSLQRAYNRLNQLKNAGILESRRGEELDANYWALGQLGYRAIKSVLPPLRSDGYKAEHVSHDALVTAIHLGHWFLEKPSTAQLFSEQQLRRYQTESLPHWVPKSQLHRPDGYWFMPKNCPSNRLYALEVELNIKSPSAYERATDFYKLEPTIDRIFWFVTSASACKRVSKLLAAGDNSASSQHSFVLLEEFKKRGWDASIHLGVDQGKAFEASLSTQAVPPWKGGRTPVESTSISTPQHLLDSRKSYVKSKLSASHQNQKIHN